MPEAVILPALFLTVAFSIWTIVGASQQRHRLRLLTDFNARVIDRLGSINDFSEFAKTDAGARFLNGVITDAPKGRPGERILRATQAGIVLVALATGLLLLGAYFQSERRDAFIVVGVVALSLGVGFLVSSTVSHRISSSLGLLAPATKPQD